MTRDLLGKNRVVCRFLKLMIAFRKAHPSLGRSRFWRDDIRCFGVDPEVDWSSESRSLAFFPSGESLRIWPKEKRCEPVNLTDPHRRALIASFLSISKTSPSLSVQLP